MWGSREFLELCRLARFQSKALGVLEVPVGLGEHQGAPLRDVQELFEAGCHAASWAASFVGCLVDDLGRMEKAGIPGVSFKLEAIRLSSAK